MAMLPYTLLQKEPKMLSAWWVLDGIRERAESYKGQHGHQPRACFGGLQLLLSRQGSAGFCSCSPTTLGQPDGQYLSCAEEKSWEKQKLR